MIGEDVDVLDLSTDNINACDAIRYLCVTFSNVRRSEQGNKTNQRTKAICQLME